MPQVYSKAMATITDAGDDFDYGPNGGFTAVLSTPSLDRDGDRLKRVDWQEPLPARLPLDIDHGMTVADTVGSFVPYFDGDTLMMRAYFASTAKAQDTRALVVPDPVTGIRHIGAVSVAFMEDKQAQKDGKPHRELLNAGIVAIPSNRDAVILASKAADAIASVQKQVDDGVITADEVEEDTRSIGEVIGDLLSRSGPQTKASDGTNALTQAIHDASVHLGAVCQVQVTEPDGDESGEADGANKSITWDYSKGVPVTKQPSLTVELPDDIDLDTFKAGLEALLQPASPDAGEPQEDSPEESPADEAATDEVPAEDAAEDSAEPEVADWQTPNMDLLLWSENPSAP